MRLTKKYGNKQLRFSFRGNNFVIFKEKPGVVSPNACWVCLSGRYMYDAETFFGLLWTIYREWEENQNLVG